MIKCVVDRRSWLRGRGPRESRLLNTAGERCCIGFLAKVLGVKDEEMLCTKMLEDVFAKPAQVFVTDCSTSALNYAYKVNDAMGITEEERERCLIQIGKDLDVEFNFIN